MIYTEIEGTNRSSNIKWDSFTISDQINQRNTIHFEMTGNYTERPLVGQDIYMWETSSKTTKVYGGTIAEKRQTKYSYKLKWEIDCTDFEKILDRFRFPESYQSQTAGYIIRDMISTYLSDDGITDTGVEDGPALKKVVFGHDFTCAEAIDRICDITNYVWYVDYDKVLHFHSRAENDAPFDIDDNSVIYDVEVIQNLHNYRNVQYLRAGNDISGTKKTETFQGDGETRTFTVKQPIAEEPTITLNPGEAGEEVISSGDIGIMEQSEDKRWYWQNNSKQINQDTDYTVLGDTDTLQIEYYYYYPIRVVDQNGAQINDRQNIEGGSGIYEDAVQKEHIDDLEQAQDEVNGLLENYGSNIPEKVTYKTTQSGLQAGQIQQIARTSHGIDGEYLLSEVELIPAGWDSEFSFFYRVTAAISFLEETWVKFFKNLAQATRKRTIRENEVLSKIKTYYENLEITDSLSIDTDAYETRINYAQVGFSEISCNTNMKGATGTYADFTSLCNGEGVTETENTDYNTFNISGLTETFDGNLDDVNVIGLTSPDNAVAGAPWIHVEGISSRY